MVFVAETATFQKYVSTLAWHGARPFEQDRLPSSRENARDQSSSLQLPAAVWPENGVPKANAERSLKNQHQRQCLHVAELAHGNSHSQRSACGLLHRQRREHTRDLVVLVFVHYGLSRWVHSKNVQDAVDIGHHTRPHRRQAPHGHLHDRVVCGAHHARVLGGDHHRKRRHVGVDGVVLPLHNATGAQNGGQAREPQHPDRQGRAQLVLQDQHGSPDGVHSKLGVQEPA